MHLHVFLKISIDIQIAMAILFLSINLAHHRPASPPRSASPAPRWLKRNLSASKTTLIRILLHHLVKAYFLIWSNLISQIKIDILCQYISWCSVVPPPPPQPTWTTETPTVTRRAAPKKTESETFLFGHTGIYGGKIVVDFCDRKRFHSDFNGRGIEACSLILQWR